MERSLGVRVGFDRGGIRFRPGAGPARQLLTEAARQLLTEAARQLLTEAGALGG